MHMMYVIKHRTKRTGTAYIQWCGMVKNSTFVVVICMASPVRLPEMMGLCGTKTDRNKTGRKHSNRSNRILKYLVCGFWHLYAKKQPKKTKTFCHEEKEISNNFAVEMELGQACQDRFLPIAIKGFWVFVQRRFRCQSITLIKYHT